MRCNRCVLDDEINLDLVDGVCQYCRFADEKSHQRQIDKDQLPWVIYDIKRRSQGEYDCLVGLSGGVDSSYMLPLIVGQGLRPLTFSIDNGWQTPQAQENIMKLVEGLKVPFYRYTIDLEQFKDLQKAFIKSGVKNIEIPTDHILMASSYEMAKKYGIKTIVSGGNWQTEGTLPEDYGYNAKDLTYIKAIAKKYGAKIDKLPTISLLKYLKYRNIDRIRTVNILDHVVYNREEAKRELEDKFGWQDYGEKHAESQFTKWFQNVYLPKVHGLDKRKPHLTSLIHSGQITKQDAVRELALPLEQVENPFDIELKAGIDDYPTNQKWEGLWIKLFNTLKKWGYKA